MHKQIQYTNFKKNYIRIAKKTPMLKHTIAIAALLLTNKLTNAQNCKVLLPDLVGTYEGACNSGKAEGFGTAKGKDAFSGMFLKGKPNGRGTYTWADGHYYRGDWKDGQKDGEGELHYTSIDGQDSVITGRWVKDKMQAANNDAYTVYTQTKGISTLKIDTLRQNYANEILIEVENTSGGMYSTSGTNTKMDITDIQIIKGNYDQVVKQNGSAKRTITKILNPTFPLRCRFIINNEQLEIEFKTKNSWHVSVFCNL
jgi:hypothetical protein